MAEQEPQGKFEIIKRAVKSKAGRAGLAIVVACATVAGVITEFPGILKVPGNTALAVGDGLGVMGESIARGPNAEDFKETGGFDLIPTQPNGFIATRRLSGTYSRFSEVDFIKAAMERVAKQTGCDIGQVSPIFNGDVAVGERAINAYLILTNCK